MSKTHKCLTIVVVTVGIRRWFVFGHPDKVPFIIIQFGCVKPRKWGFYPNLGFCIVWFC